MPTPRATISPVSRPPPPLLLLVGPEVDVDMLEAPWAAEEVEMLASEDDGHKEGDDNDVKEDVFAAADVTVVLVTIVLAAVMLAAVVPAAAVLTAVVPAVVASPRLQYAAKTVAACIASGRGEVRQEFRMFVEIWSEYS